MSRPAFASVRANYRTTGGHRCSAVYTNTCALRVSEALVAAEASLLDAFKRSRFNLCPDHSFVRGAQDLAAVLREVWGSPLGWDDLGGTPPGGIVSKKGVVCYMSIPGFNGQGHIDLWDAGKPVGESYWDAKRVWFWQLG